MTGTLEQILAAYGEWLDGNDLILVGEIAGHKRLETTRRYSLPSIEDREQAMEGLRVDY